MARIFISHSSSNNAAAIVLRDWIVKGGWDDEPFLDLDPERGIAAGQRWERALYEAADRCEAVVFLISPDWLKSSWCMKEFNLAQKLNKRLIGVLIEPVPLNELPTRLTGTWQIVDLASGNDHDIHRAVMPDLSTEEHVSFSRSGLIRLSAGLDKAGLDPRYFAWPPENDPNRSPYPGLRPLDLEDAGIFLGREASTIVVLDRLRGLRAAAPPRSLVILGASGAGKSSFLRAGLIPRLIRDDANFRPLPIVRPEMAAITGKAGLIQVLQQAFAERSQPVNRAEIEAAVLGDLSGLRSLLLRLAGEANPSGPLPGSPPGAPTIVIAIDQAEELFLSEGSGESRAFLQILRDLMLAEAPSVLVLFTIRSDSYEHLQTEVLLEGIRQETFSLPPMPRGAYQMIIVEPARRLRGGKRSLVIEPALTEALLQDIDAGGAKDALPLLAFTLERLYREYGADGNLLTMEYEALGRIKGSIRAAVASALKAADANPGIPESEPERLALLRRALIPAMAIIDPNTHEPRRRTARLSEIPPDTRTLVDCLVQARLLATDTDPKTGETIVEPAHESLLRQWDALKGWLDEDSAALLSLEGLRAAARDWDEQHRPSDWLSHAAGRLEDAERTRGREDFGRLLGPVERDYLDACRAQENERRNRELEDARKLAEAQAQIVRRTRMGLAFASILTLGALWGAGYGFFQANEAGNQRGRAEQRSAVLAANLANSFADEGALDSALLLMLDAARWFTDADVPDQIRIAMTKAVERKSRTQTATLFPNPKPFETDQALFLVDPASNDIFAITASAEPARLHAGTPEESPVRLIGPGTRPEEALVVRQDQSVQAIDSRSGELRPLGQLPFPSDTSDRTYDIGSAEFRIGDGGLVIGEVTFSGPDGMGGGTYTAILDTKSGALLAGHNPIFKPVYDDVVNATEQSIVVFERESNTFFKLIQAGGSLEKRPTALKPDHALRLRYGSCVPGLTKEVRADVMKEIDELQNYEWFSCKPNRNGALFTLTHSGSAGEFRKSELIDGQGERTEVRQMLSELGGSLLSTSNLDWVRVNDPPAHADPLADSHLGVMVNRDVFVANLNEGSLVMKNRHIAAPVAARFIDPTHLLVVEGTTGKTIVHAFGPDARHGSVFLRPSAHLLGTNQATPTLHHGTCVGASIPSKEEPYSDVLPDGRRITLSESATTDGLPDTRELSLEVSSGTTTILLPKGSSCLAFSGDWKYLSIADDHGLRVYDFNMVLAAGTIQNNELATIAIEGLTSALFIGTAREILTTDFSHRVLAWEPGPDGHWDSREIYRGEEPIIYAEPDSEGKRLLLIEVRGGATKRGFLYSLPAHQVWYDLGEDYKWLGVTFSRLSEVLVSKHDEWTDVFPIPSLSALIAVAESQLSPECAPAAPGNYRSSPCWPESAE